MRLKGGSYMYIGLMVFTLIVIGYSLTMPFAKSKMLPILFSGGVFALSAIGLWREIKAPPKPKATAGTAEPPKEKKPEEGWRGYILNAAWITGFVLASYLVGFLITMPLFVLFYTRWLGSKWPTAIIAALISSAILYSAFEYGFKIQLFRGLLFDLITG